MGTFTTTITVNGVSVPGALVDTGALYCVIPEGIARAAGIQPDRTRTLRLADGAVRPFPMGHARVTVPAYSSEEISVLVVIGSEDSMTLLGATALEMLALAADPANKILLPVIAPCAAIWVERISPAFFGGGGQGTIRKDF